MKYKGKKTMLPMALSLLVAMATALAQEEEPSKLLDFWVGTWEVSWDESEGKKGKGINRIEKILDDKVVQEHFEIHEGKGKGFKGTSISVYQAAVNQWKQSWADSQGSFFCLTGKLTGEKKIFQTDIKETADGKKNTQRMVFYNITRDALTWDWESSTDGGEAWTLNWRIDYKRKK
ncbi:DUF1579 domain-containing protein [Muricauda sp. JGD-17]|uniref:DUF1579 domain-containing protein n=1 Tax=Flagellimonas ochracea TaxID=2696472 RepID=A0A964WY24_9FLAO|nr:DUF1579 family protein [Allomuricauda ochracea]NAY92169.1 DUF1579 domain-containing protein [Allomuricauda ochracea]